MRFSTLWRTSTFRITVLNGLLFVLGMVALLGMVYLRSVGYLTARVDRILRTEADALMGSPRPGLRQRLDTELDLNGDKINIFALFSADGRWVAGNLAALPPAAGMDGVPFEIRASRAFPAGA